MTTNGTEAPIEECRRCKFFKSGNPLIPTAVGVCRRHGRFPVMVGVNQQGPVIQGFYGPHQPNDWCGDYMPKVTLALPESLSHRPLDAT